MHIKFDAGQVKMITFFISDCQDLEILSAQGLDSGFGNNLDLSEFILRLFSCWISVQRFDFRFQFKNTFLSLSLQTVLRTPLILPYLSVLTVAAAHFNVSLLNSL